MTWPVLHPFQADLWERVRAARLRGKRIIVVQGATGCGKNTWAAFVVRQAADKGSAVLCMVHRRRLVDQISQRLQQFDIDHGILMRGEKPDCRCRVQVASRDTLLSRCVRNDWRQMPEADLVIVDEAHHAADAKSEYRRVLEQYPKATILLLSATPVGPDGQGLGPWAQALECAAPTSQLVNGGFLVPVKCYAPSRKKKGKRMLRGIAGDLVESWQQYAENKPTIVFCSRVAHSRDAVTAFQEQGITAAHIDAETPDEERDRIFDEITAGRIKVVSNVGIVGEGVDVPELEVCQIFCEVNSRVRFLQAVGRIMRVLPGKKYGVLIDHSGAVFRHGFPDEDTQWTLAGNADVDFANKHKAGETGKAFYCKQCELAYHGSEVCPECGRKPAKPPKSIFAPLPPPVRSRNELLTEADRGGERPDYSREAKIQFWFIALTTAIKRNGNFKMASQIFHRRFSSWPDDDFPCNPVWAMRSRKIREVYPDFGKRKSG